MKKAFMTPGIALPRLTTILLSDLTRLNRRKTRKARIIRSSPSGLLGSSRPTWSIVVIKTTTKSKICVGRRDQRGLAMSTHVPARSPEVPQPTRVHVDEELCPEDEEKEKLEGLEDAVRAARRARVDGDLRLEDVRHKIPSDEHGHENLSVDVLVEIMRFVLVLPEPGCRGGRRHYHQTVGVAFLQRAIRGNDLGSRVGARLAHAEGRQRLQQSLDALDFVAFSRLPPTAHRSGQGCHAGAERTTRHFGWNLDAVNTPSKPPLSEYRF